MTERTHEVYDRDYAGRWHWRYTRPTAYVREWAKVRFDIIRRFGIPKGSRVLEIACGQGFHVNLMRRFGMRVTGVDLSREGIRFARARFPACDFRHLDAEQEMPFEPESFDVIWSHGAGFFHYCITDDATERIVRTHLRYLKPGGLYIVTIYTDLSGAKPPLYTGEWQHTLDDFRSMLGRFGMPYTVAWEPTRNWVPLVGPRLPNGLAICSLRKEPGAASRAD